MEEVKKNTMQQLFQVWRALPPGKKISFVFTLSLVIGGFVVLMLWASKPTYQVLFSKLDTADAARITEKLKEKRVPFQLKEGGSAILVPDNMVYQLRLDLASDGIPRGRHVGFEIFDEMRFGTTEFVQKLRYQQALQGELARTIMEFDAVAQARVHLVQSGDTLFVEPEKPATASVVLRLYPGRVLDRRQLQGIINLVARAVEGLKPENVTVVDVAGGLLSKGGETDSPGMLSRSHFEYQQKLEQSLQKRIRTMLEPIVGINKVVARVSAELDFGQVSISEEKYDPDSVAVRSEQRLKETSAGSGEMPSGSPDLQAQVYGNQKGGSVSSNRFNKENAIINYEINRVNKQITSSVGDIKRLSAAVVIDGPYVTETGADGKEVQKFVGRNRKEIKTFEDIIKKAIGFNEARGDQVNVSNIAFNIQETENAPFPEKKGTWLDYAKKMTKPLFNIMLVILFFLLAIRPFKKWLTQTGDYIGSLSLSQGGEVPQITSRTGEGESGKENSKMLSDIANSNPDMAAEIIRNWIKEED